MFSDEEYDFNERNTKEIQYILNNAKPQVCFCPTFPLLYMCVVKLNALKA